MKHSILFLLVSLLMIACQQDQNSSELLDSFEIEQGFQIELMAMEPLISDPVDMEIDELGRWYVVEMHGYPLDLSGSGKVVRLTDTNDDGIPDASTVFMDSLVLPTGIMRWKRGFLVTDPPNVLYLEDTNDDGKADVKEIVLTGFARSNPQHNVNNPIYGIDNWIYLSHEGAISSKGFSDVFGDFGSDVHYPNLADAIALPQNANGMGVRFKPDDGKLEMRSAKGQFGHTFDPWGHHFLTSNADHLFHEVIDASYIQRNKHSLVPSGRTYIPKSGKGFEIYPITKNPDHQLLTDVGMMTSACGIVWYKGGIFPTEYQKAIFTAEPVHNMVHVDKITDKGATFEAENMLQNREFLASTDSWFRPVNHYIGPDGAIYLLDYHRKIIEHPEWLSDEVINSGDLYAGINQGRIYRITPTGTLSPDFLDNMDMNALSSDELIKLLNHDNDWWRTHAQRLLMDNSDDGLISEITQAISNDLNASGKIHAMWILEGKNAMTDLLLLELLEDDSPHIREQAIKISEKRSSQSVELSSRLLSMTNDQNAKVRYQLLLTLGELDSDVAENARTELLFKDIEDDWVQYAALSAKALNVVGLYEKACIELLNKQSVHTTAFFRRMSEVISQGSDSKAINIFLTSILSSSEDQWYSPLVLEGISNALSKNKDLQISKNNIMLLEAKFDESTNADIRSQSIDLLHDVGYFKGKENNLVNKALAQLSKSNADPSLISDALKIIGRTDADQHVQLFNSYLSNETDPIIRSSALNGFDFLQNKKSLESLISLWPQLHPDERTQAVGVLLHSDEGELLILTSIQSGQIHTSSLSWPETVQLLNSYNDNIRDLARVTLHGNELNADSIWNHYKEALTFTGNSLKGAIVFKKSCGICHQKSGENGVAFGPDLASVQNRSNSALLLDIIQPNRSIADGYELWLMELKNGTVLSGVIANEGPSSLTIRNTTGQEQTINRTEIKSLKAFETSAMPENLQTQMSTKDLADLLAYIKNN